MHSTWLSAPLFENGQQKTFQPENRFSFDSAVHNQIIHKHLT